MGAVVDYSFVSGNGAQRFGTIRVNFNNSSVVLDETSTTDLGGSTDAVVFSASVSGGVMTLIVTNNEGTAIDLVAVYNLIFRN
jgi:hypothetical protein